MCSETFDCTVCSRSAAAVKLPSSATARSVSSCRTSITTPSAESSRTVCAARTRCVDTSLYEIDCISFTPLTDGLVIHFTWRVRDGLGSRNPPPAPELRPSQRRADDSRGHLEPDLHWSADVDDRRRL